MRLKLMLGERRLLGRRRWYLAMKKQKKDVWNREEKRKVKRRIYQDKKRK